MDKKMDDLAILNQSSDGSPEHVDVEHFILDHNGLEQSRALLLDIYQQLADVNALHVAVESQVDTIALEGLGETLKKYWDQFLAFLQRIWAKIVEFFEMHFTMLGRRRLHINRMVKVVKSLSTNPNVYQKLKQGESEFRLMPGNVESFSVNGQTSVGYQSLQAHMNQTQATVKLITQGYGGFIVKRAELIERAIQGATVENAKATMVKVMEELTHQGFDTHNAEMLGNVKAVYGVTTSEAGATELDQFRLSIVKQARERTPEVMFTVMKIDELAKIYTTMEAVLDDMDMFKHGAYKDIVAHAKSMMSGTDRFVKSVSSMLGAEGEAGSASTYREILALNKHYLNWIKTPTTELIHHITTTFFHMQMELAHNIRFYEAQPAENLFTVLGLA